METEIKTLPNGLQYSRNWEYDGCVVMHNAKTIKRYRELKEQQYNIDCYSCDCFFAFNNQQFEEGKAKIRPLKDGEKLINVGAGLFGTRGGIDRYFAKHEDIDKMIKQECDPQEVYFYEYNNHESMISWEGDSGPFKIIERLFGEEVASKIIRLL